MGEHFEVATYDRFTTLSVRRGLPAGARGAALLAGQDCTGYALGPVAAARAPAACHHHHLHNAWVVMLPLLAPPLQVEEEGLVGGYQSVQAGDCIVAFSRRDIYDIKQLVEQVGRPGVASRLLPGSSALNRTAPWPPAPTCTMFRRPSIAAAWCTARCPRRPAASRPGCSTSQASAPGLCSRPRSEAACSHVA